MIAPAMIRKLGKTYSDKAMTKDKRIHYQVGAWSNGDIAFKEPLPKHLADVKHKCIFHDGFWSEVETNMVEGKELVQVWPVEIRPISSGDESKFATGSYLSDSGKRLVRLSDGNGLSVWLDAGYLSAILKRQPTATFYVANSKDLHPTKSAVVLAKNGRTFAIVMPMVKDECNLQDSPWSIVNTDLDAAREFDTANRLAYLLPDRPGTKWHKVFYMGMMVEVRRSGSNNKGRTLHVRMAGRDAAANISLYDGRGVQ